MVFMSDVGGICQGYGGNGTELIPHKVEQQHTVSGSVGRPYWISRSKRTYFETLLCSSMKGIETAIETCT